jgi:hypothetical protein
VTPIAISLGTFAIVLCGAVVGDLLRRALPKHHLDADTKDVVRLGTGLIGTIAALVLGLLIASASSSYDSQGNQVQRMAVNLILLDQLLTQYGAETRAAREELRASVGPLIQRIWHGSLAGQRNPAPFRATQAAEGAYAANLALTPQTETQGALKTRAIDISNDLVRGRLLLLEQEGGSIPAPFLAVLVFWLAVIFASFSLFSRVHATLAIALVVFALSAASTIFLILELSQPFYGLMQISSAPLANALAPLP